MGFFNITFSRRCIAVDIGQSRIKAILAERKGKRIEVLHAFSLDLQEEGLLTLEETDRHISRILLEMGDHPISLVIPQHIAVSHLIALRSEGHGGWERMIEEETQKLTGLSESAIVYDYFRLRPFQRNRNPVWVTISRERELDLQITRLHGHGLAVGEVTNTGNALASAYLATQKREKRVVLVDVGAVSTTVVVLVELQPIYATSLPFGGELFTEAVASARDVGFDEAEAIKKTEFLFDGDDALPEFVEAFEKWRDELHKILHESLKDQLEQDDEPVPVLLSGGATLQTGFLEYLGRESPYQYSLWRDDTCGVDPQTYAVAYGAALAGLKIAPVRSSLLPKILRQAHFRGKQATFLNSLAGLLLAILFVLLLWDASMKRQALEEGQARISDLEEAYAQSQVVTELLAERNNRYQKTVPIVQQQKRTRDLLKTIGLMQQIRNEHDAWFVLLADGRSYLEGQTLRASSNGTVRDIRGRGMLEPSAGLASAEAEPVAAWNRFVVEISVPGTGSEIHDILRDVVNTFGSKEIFHNVDTLAAADRKAIVNPNVTLPDQTFSLTLELIPSEFSLPDIEPQGTLPPTP